MPTQEQTRWLNHIITLAGGQALPGGRRWRTRRERRA